MPVKFLFSFFAANYPFYFMMKFRWDYIFLNY